MKARSLLLVAASTLAIGGVGSVWWLGSALSAPVPRTLGPPPEVLVGARSVAFPSGSGSTLHATLEQSRALFAAAPEPKELWVVPDAAHQDFERLVPEEYERRVLGFLERALGAASLD